jgi:hypothetical protein
MLNENLQFGISQSMRQFGLGYFAVWSILMIITDILTVMYLGPKWDSKEIIDPSDWRRKWILTLAWIKLVVFGLLIFFTFGTITLMPIVNIFLAIWIFYNVIVILALGPTFADEPVKIDDWKKNFIILVSWFSIAVVIISFVSVFMPTLYVPQRKFDMWQRPSLRRRPVYGPENQYGPFMPYGSENQMVPYGGLN